MKKPKALMKALQYGAHVIAALLFCSMHATSVTEAIPEYPAFCLKAAYDDNVFSTFRRNGLYMQIVEGLNPMAGKLLEDLILAQYHSVVPFMKKIEQDDSVGNPFRFQYRLGQYSPCTMRYIKIAAELEEKCGPLRALNIVEIGGGYGGQCKIIKDTFGFTTYTIIDIAECIPLARKFLDHFGVDGVNFLSNRDINHDVPCDLVISNYALSEVDWVGQLVYLEYIIDAAPRGYITYNYQPSSQPLQVNSFIERIKQHHTHVMVEDEKPLTGEGNLVITWSPGSPPI